MTSSYLDVLAAVHRRLQPATYLEIGVQHGYSFTLSRADSIGIDPTPTLRFPASGPVHRMTSDEYFAQQIPFEGRGIAFAFIDGMHLFEHALRDFINIERHSSPGAVAALDDVLPRDSARATRQRNTRQWTGDVWKIVPALRKYRPDLRLTLIDCDPEGTLLVAGLDPGSDVLSSRYEEIISVFSAPEYETPPTSVINRSGAVSLEDWLTQENP